VHFCEEKNFKKPEMAAISLAVLMCVNVFGFTLSADNTFGDVFAWGVATSAFQTEGAWNTKGLL